MDASDYYQKLNSECNSILQQSLEKNDAQNKIHSLIHNIQTWFELLERYEVSSLLKNVMEELNISCLQMLQGLYRGSFVSLRLSLEMLCGLVYFSAHDIEYREWSNEKKDLMWSHLLCPDNGILSKKFTDAYFPELNNTASDIHKKIKELYRELSEMVHGNSRTWDYDNPPSLTYAESHINKYKEYIKIYALILNYILCLRFLNSLSPIDIFKVEPYIGEYLEYVEEIRTKIGGQKNG